MKLSTRNVIKGTVKKITPGAVNAEIIVELPNVVDSSKFMKEAK